MVKDKMNSKVRKYLANQIMNSLVVRNDTLKVLGKLSVSGSSLF